METTAQYSLLSGPLMVMVSVRSARNPTARSSNSTEPCFVRRKLTLALARLRRCFGQLPSEIHFESRRTTGAVAVAASLRERMSFIFFVFLS